MRPAIPLLACFLFGGSVPSAFAEEAKYRSHPPMRALPTASNRPLDKGPHYFVDATKGSDQNDGSKAKPWKTITHGIKQLKPGDTLCLRGGTYYEHVTITLAGAKEKPITIRSHPGELAVLDGGLRDFFEEPAKAWEPVKNGAEGEFRSTKAYPGLGEVVLGHFADSMVPLHGYRNLIDLRSKNEYWNLKDKLDAESQFYCGPGVWYDKQTGKLHARFAHTTLKVLGENNYRGETDPRKLPLVIGTSKVPLKLDGAKHIRVRDLVVRGGSRATIDIANAEDIDLDNVTAFGGSPALLVQRTNGLRIVDSALRGISAPWSSRAGHKYRGVAAYLLTVRESDPPSRDFEIAHSELTDSHDGPYLGTIKGLKFHHNLVDNFNDDGIYLTSTGKGGDLHIYQNRISRCLHAFSFAGEHPTGSGVYIFRNLIDLRSPVHYTWPTKPDDPVFQSKTAGGPEKFPWRGRLCGDHGSPTWEPIFFYHNTVITQTPTFRDFYAAGWGGHMNGAKRRVFNNIFVQTDGKPGLNFASPEEDLQVDGNLLWSIADGPAVTGDYFAAFRKSKLFEASKKKYPPGWGASDRFGDPLFVEFAVDWKAKLDPRLQAKSPAIDAGVELPGAWPDPLRRGDKGKPDLGALPLGAELFGAGKAAKR